MTKQVPLASVFRNEHNTREGTTIISNERKLDSHVEMLSRMEKPEIAAKIKGMIEKNYPFKDILREAAGGVGDPEMIMELSRAGLPLAKKIQDHRVNMVRRDRTVNNLKKELLKKSISKDFSGGGPGQLNSDIRALRSGKPSEIDEIIKRRTKH